MNFKLETHYMQTANRNYSWSKSKKGGREGRQTERLSGGLEAEG